MTGQNLGLLVGPGPNQSDFDQAGGQRFVSNMAFRIGQNYERFWWKSRHEAAAMAKYAINTTLKNSAKAGGAKAAEEAKGELMEVLTSIRMAKMTEGLSNAAIAKWLTNNGKSRGRKNRTLQLDVAKLRKRGLIPARKK
jgi:hypothetical protein